MTTVSGSAVTMSGLVQFARNVVGDDDQQNVRVGGDVNLSKAPLLEQQLKELVEDGAREIVLDITDLKLIDAAGLSVLVRAADRLRRCDGGLQLRSPSRSVRKTLQMTGLDTTSRWDITRVTRQASVDRRLASGVREYLRSFDASVMAAPRWRHDVHRLGLSRCRHMADWSEPGPRLGYVSFIVRHHNGEMVFPKPDLQTHRPPDRWPGRGTSGPNTSG